MKRVMGEEKNENGQTYQLTCLFFVFIFLLTTVFGGIILSLTPKVMAESSYSSAKAMCVMETSSKRVLNSKNMDTKLAMASTTKIMTAITAIENCDDLDKTFEISPKAVGVPGTSLYLRKGEVFSTRDLLYGLMLISGNDASVAIGEHISGSVSEFVKLMNKTAKKIGAESSHFDNTHGLDSKTHYTTAYNLALITSYAMMNPTFKEIVSTKNVKITNTDGKSRYLKNKNKLLNSFDGCNGVKTGFTDDAGRCLVSSAEREGMNVVCVVLNCGPMFEECSRFMEEAFASYKLYDLTKFYNLPTEIKVTNGRQETVKVDTFGKYMYPLTENEKESVKIRYEIVKILEAPIEKGQQVGKVEIYIGKDLHFSEKIFTIESVRRNSLWQKLFDVFAEW